MRTEGHVILALSFLKFLYFVRMDYVCFFPMFNCLKLRILFLTKLSHMHGASSHVYNQIKQFMKE